MSDADLYSEDTARALEAHDSFTDMRTELTRLRTQNAELLEALKESRSVEGNRDALRKFYPAGTAGAEDAWREFGKWETSVKDKVRAAIRRAEEGK
jgi:hypothetical protein